VKRALPVACLIALACACTPGPQVPPTSQPAPPKPAVAPPASAPAPAKVAPADTAPAEAEAWNLPGGLGPLTTRLQLDARFGKANVQEASFDGAEGIGTYPALVVFPEDPRRRLELVLDADNPDAPIRELRVRGQDSAWRLDTGLHPGMTLAEVVARNGAPVSFYGLGWDYGGTVQDWHGGALANAVGNPVFHRVTLAARDGAGDAALPAGDATFRSDDPRWPTIGTDLVVAELGVSWPDDGD
jgi:hypothetical protein